MIGNKGRLKPLRFVTNDDGCMMCISHEHDKAKGYFKLTRRVDGVAKNFRMHRYLYELANGPVPSDYDVHHTCENTSCLNVDHMEPIDRVTHSAMHGNLDMWRANESRYRCDAIAAAA